MKGTSYSVPFGMIFKKHYCSKCGNRLEKERIHRVVTKDDKDYYRYHDFGTFPLRDYDVYDYRFKCPSCETRISYNEQCTIEKIQKKHGRKILFSTEIKEDYKECKQSNDKRVLCRNILVSIIISLLGLALVYIFNDDKTLESLGYISLFWIAFAIIAIVGVVRRYKGNYKLKIKQTYSYEKESLFKKLHTYSSHNKKLIDSSNQCYCFYCEKSFESNKVVVYTDNGQTAICPECGIDAVIPDSIEESLDENIITEMHEYWF